MGRAADREAGKGGKLVTVPITSTIREILWPLQGHHPEFVFTYVAQRTRDGRVQGERYPLTYRGVKIAWRRLRKRAGVTGFRFHDFRHDLGTKLLRETGNLKLVQRALNHRRISRRRCVTRTCSTTRSPTPWSASASHRNRSPNSERVAKSERQISMMIDAPDTFGYCRSQVRILLPRPTKSKA